MNLRGAIVLLSFAVVFVLLCNFSPAWSQEIGAFLEEEMPEYPQVTLRLSGSGCDININEAELLRLEGVLLVDIESKPGRIVVTYDPAKLDVHRIKAAVGKKMGRCAASEDDVKAGGGMSK